LTGLPLFACTRIYRSVRLATRPTHWERPHAAPHRFRV
jgi:hypothetical protein